MRVGMMRQHDLEGVEQDVDTFFRSEPADIEKLFGFWSEIRRPGEECDVRAVVDMAASLCEGGKAPPHAGSDEVTDTQHQVSSFDPPLDDRRVKLLEPLTVH